MKSGLLIAVFLLLTGALAWQLAGNSQHTDYPRAWLGKPWQTELPADLDVKDSWRVYNMFATWCSPCLAEHPLLLVMQKNSGAPVIGIAWKDKQEAVNEWIATHGNPYHTLVIDEKGTMAIDAGIRGVPETFLVSPQNRIMLHRAGPIDAQWIAEAERLTREN